MNYKATMKGGISPITGFKWPLPKNGKPGKWVKAEGESNAGRIACGLQCGLLGVFQCGLQSGFQCGLLGVFLGD